MPQQTPQESPSAGPPAAGQDAAVSELAAKVAHELNNPLDAVLRFVSLAQRNAKANQYKDIDRYLADAQFGLQRMTEVLRELMDLGRQTSEILGPHEKERLPLTDSVARAIRTARGLAEQKHITLVVKSLLNESLCGRFDLRVAQILSNLLKNALEAAPEGSMVRITLQRPSPQQNQIAILIEDHGPGIPETLLPELFTPFLTTKADGGHGLGLAISRELALSLGGELVVRNRAAPETGCVATLTLPITPDTVRP